MIIAVSAASRATRPGGPAAAAGVHPGDLITALGPTKITGINDLVAATMAHHPGTRTTLTIIRNGTRLTLTITLGREPTTAPAN
jgi:S1-C subfamily serine protease